MKVLDLFAGPGGCGRGFLEEYPAMTYVAVEYDPLVCDTHKINNPSAEVICGDAYDWVDRIEEFDFVWMSPPCKTHSRLNTIHRKRIDTRLWDLIRLIKKSSVCCIIENVVPFYRIEYAIEPILLERHYIWANFPIGLIRRILGPSRPFEQMNTPHWTAYKGLFFKNREEGRNCFHPFYARELFRWFLVYKGII